MESQKAREAYKQNCYFFYDSKNNRDKTLQEIKEKFKCQLSKNNRKMLYAKRDDKNEYDFVSQKELGNNLCISNYNNYFNSESQKLNLETDLLSNCSKNSFRTINEDYDKLLQYAYQLSDELHVDEQIKQFVIDLVVYTNINKEGLKELYKGAFVIIRDKGFFYNRFKCESARMCNIKQWIPESSHDSLHKDNQYRIGNGIIYNCDENGICNKNESNNAFDLLIGTSPINDFYGDTWIQFEYANLLTAWNKWALHAYSTFRHVRTQKNIGPLGESEYAEYVKPLILEICKPASCEQAPCEPIPCVRPKIDLENYSNTFITQKNIILPDYKLIKNFIKSKFGYNNRISINQIKDSIEKEFEEIFDPLHYVPDKTETQTESQIEFENLLKKLEPYVIELAKVDNFKYDREQIIEIMFLIYYYANLNNTNYAEMIDEINTRYSSNRTTGGKKTRRNKKKITNKKKYKKTRRTR
jgi:hypothetical protein